MCFAQVDGLADERTTRIQRRYKAKLKADPLRWQESCRKARERSKRYRENLIERAKSDKEILEAKKERDRIRQRNYRARKKLKEAEMKQTLEKPEKNVAIKSEYG